MELVIVSLISDRFSIQSLFSRRSRFSSISSGSITSIQAWKTRTSTWSWVTLIHKHTSAVWPLTQTPDKVRESLRIFLLGLPLFLENPEHQHYPEIRKGCIIFSVRSVIGQSSKQPEPNIFTKSPFCPAAPVLPSSPFWPFSPQGPWGPGKPGGPWGPCHPREPGAPYIKKKNEHLE